MKLTVAWLSAGVSSFIAAYLIKDEIDEFYYIDIADQHPDSIRFIKDCEKLLDKPIKVLKSKQHRNEIMEECGIFCEINLQPRFANGIMRIFDTEVNND